MRLVDWYLGLATGQKVVVGTAALVLALTYLASIVIMLAAGVGSEGFSPRVRSPSR